MNEPTGTLNSYFVPGFGISRAVIQSDIQYLCGPEAKVRPFTLHGRDGYLVTTAGRPLTKEQIEDLKEASTQYEERQAARAARGEGAFINQPISVPQQQNRDNLYTTLRTSNGDNDDEKNF